MRKIQVKTSKKQVNKGPKWLFKGFKGHSSKIQVLKVLKVTLLPLHVPCRNLRVGDIVLIVDHDTPRNTWTLGRVTEVTEGKDSLVRKVRLIVGSSKLDTKGKRTSPLTVLERPIQKVVLILESD